MFFAAAYTHVARGTNTLLKFATRLARIMLEFIIQSLIVGVRLHRKQFIKGGALATTGACAIFYLMILWVYTYRAFVS